MSKKNQSSLPKIPFVIETMDPMGQGVFKEEGKITFIAKTLPGEKGFARLHKSKKGVRFAQVESIDIPSKNRIEAECPHYNECPGCHYLHTDYEHELEFKQQALTQLLHKLDIDEELLSVIPATQRLGYRNRIQLHYRHKYIGLVDGLTDEVIEIPQCKMIREELKPAFTALYEDKSWAQDKGVGGHCELYLKDEAVSIEWNEDYAHGGFTQVFDEMNQMLCKEVTEYLQANKVETILDLFAGDGNLTNRYVWGKDVYRAMVDAIPNAKNKDFIALDLFADTALRSFQEKDKNKYFDVIVLDPPRKGFPNINLWVKKFQPKKMIYVSCNSATLARDLASIEGKYKVEKVILMDMFPGTYHFETIVYLSFKNIRSR